MGPQIAKKWNVNDVIAAHIRAYEPPKPTPNEMYNNMIKGIGIVINEDIKNCVDNDNT